MALWFLSGFWDQEAASIRVRERKRKKENRQEKTEGKEGKEEGEPFSLCNVPFVEPQEREDTQKLFVRAAGCQILALVDPSLFPPALTTLGASRLLSSLSFFFAQTLAKGWGWPFHLQFSDLPVLPYILSETPLSTFWGSQVNRSLRETLFSSVHV